jgi:hypothetical protein
MVGTRALLGAAAAAAACAEAPGVLVRATPGVAAGSLLRAGTAVAVCGVPASVRHTRCNPDVHALRSYEVVFLGCAYEAHLLASGF